MALKPPIRIRERAESFEIYDGPGRSVAYVYFENNPGRAAVSKRLSRSEALEAVKVMARAVADRIARNV